MLKSECLLWKKFIKAGCVAPWQADAATATKTRLAAVLFRGAESDGRGGGGEPPRTRVARPARPARPPPEESDRAAADRGRRCGGLLVRPEREPRVGRGVSAACCGAGCDVVVHLLRIDKTESRASAPRTRMKDVTQGRDGGWGAGGGGDLVCPQRFRRRGPGEAVPDVTNRLGADAVASGDQSGPRAFRDSTPRIRSHHS